GLRNRRSQVRILSGALHGFGPRARNPHENGKNCRCCVSSPIRLRKVNAGQPDAWGKSFVPFSFPRNGLARKRALRIYWPNEGTKKPPIGMGASLHFGQARRPLAALRAGNFVSAEPGVIPPYTHRGVIF